MPHPERVTKGMESSLQFGLVCSNSSTIGDAKSHDRINQQIFKQPNNKNIAKICSYYKQIIFLSFKLEYLEK